jgi:hypothetical protein
VDFFGDGLTAEPGHRGIVKLTHAADMELGATMAALCQALQRQRFFANR